MDAARMNSLLTYCRIDEPSAGEQVLLEGMLDSATAYIAQAGVKVPESGTARRAQYDQLVNAMVFDAWENRGSQAAGAVLTDNPAFRRQLNQLKLTEPVVPNSGTTGS